MPTPRLLIVFAPHTPFVQAEEARARAAAGGPSIELPAGASLWQLVDGRWRLMAGEPPRGS